MGFPERSIQKVVNHSRCGISHCCQTIMGTTLAKPQSSSGLHANTWLRSVQREVLEWLNDWHSGSLTSAPPHPSPLSSPPSPPPSPPSATVMPFSFQLELNKLPTQVQEDLIATADRAGIPFKDWNAEQYKKVCRKTVSMTYGSKKAQSKC